MESYFILDGWRIATDAFKADLLSAAQTVVSESPTVLKGASLGKPASYGDKFPHWMIYTFTTRGQCPWAERLMPAEMVAQILVVERATRPASSPSQSGRAFAEEVTEEGFAAFVDKLWNLQVVNHRATGGVEVSSTAAGSEDEFGRAMFWDQNRNVLWAHSAELVATL